MKSKYTLLESKKIKDDIYKDIANYLKKHPYKKSLDIIFIGNNVASKSYIEIKLKKAKELGIKTNVHNFTNESDENEIKNKIIKLNNDSKVGGIIVQLPLIKSFNTAEIIDTITPEKDVDKMTSYNLGKTYISKKLNNNSCTAQSVLQLINFYNINVKSLNVLILGNTIVVGKPLGAILTNMQATVTIANRYTFNLKKHLKNADMIISATGVKNIIEGKDIKHGTILFDIGFTKEGDKSYGDLNFESCKKKASMITPHIGGVGPLTVANIFLNLLDI